jgi:hypothetical protein
MVPIYLFKEKPQLSLRLTDPLAEAVGALSHEKAKLLGANAAFVDKRLCHECLASSLKKQSMK